nr:DEAD/DEAH box helicase [uncultured Terrisporobacter sp.]
MNSIKEYTRLCLIEKLKEEEVLKNIKKEIKILNNKKEIAKAKVAYRLIKSLQNTKRNKSSWKDFGSNLRQYILFFNEKVTLSQNIVDRLNKYMIDLRLTNNDGVINASYGYPQWFKYNNDLDDMYNFQERKENIKSIGDATLYKNTGYIAYNSLSQKVAIYKSLELEGGQTLLVSLPTGGGKSLVGLLPILENRGHKKTSIVIVPTVALAIDQENSSKKYFEGSKYKPKSYHSGLSGEEKVRIIKQVKSGLLPILYISPEAILNNTMYNAVLEASENDKIEYFIIDESHIVSDWGESFRTEFQFLTLLQKKMLEKTNGNLKTILLSATLSEDATETLRRLFSDGDNFIQVRGDSLRNELMIWTDNSNSKKEREYKIIDIIDSLPRPLIIYVNKKLDASKWKEKIEESGYKSIEVFTGDTPMEKRKEILDKWDEEDIDIIVATSAFGMGVDKDNVRAVIHTCIPESINRYYQEIGRAGRDGFPSVCLLSTVSIDDLNDVHELTKGAVLTTEKIVDRWEGMIKGTYHSQSGNELWIDLYNSRPSNLQNERKSHTNADWNKYVLLFMVRLNFIDIIDMNMDITNKVFDVKVRIIDFELSNNRDLLIEKVNELREVERDVVNYEIEAMKFIAFESKDDCINQEISMVYREAECICGGCPSCRNNHLEPGMAEVNIRVRSQNDYNENEDVVYSKIYGNIKRYLSYDRELYVQYDNGTSLKDIIEKLSNGGVKNIIISNDMAGKYGDIIKSINLSNDKRYCIYTYEEIMYNSLIDILDNTTALIYSEDCESMYKMSKDILNNSSSNKVIHVAEFNLFIQSENKKLEYIIDGITINMNLI